MSTKLSSGVTEISQRLVFRPNKKMNVFHCSALDKKLKISPVTCMIVLHPMTLHTHPDRVYSCDVFQQNYINSGIIIIS